MHFHEFGVPLPTLYDTGVGRYGAGAPGGATPLHARYGAVPGGGPFYPGGGGVGGGGGVPFGHQVLSPQQHQALQNRLYGGPHRPLGGEGGGGGRFGGGGGLGGVRGGLGGPPMRMGAIEFLLYNMAAMLAGVAAGYDVRLSNVSPVHPKLLPRRSV